MLKVSDAFNSAFAAPDRELHARVTIGKTVYDSDDLTSINYDSGAMTGEQFSIGSTYMNSAKIIFSHLVEGLKQLDEVLVEFGVLKPDGTVEYVKMGTFIVDDKIQMDRNNNTTTIECMDRMTMLGGTYVSKLTYPARIKDVAIEIANMAGVKANETSFARLSENKINQPTGYTYRDAIGLIAQFQMGFALFDRDGLLDIRTLQDNSFKIDPNQYFLKGLVKNETFFKLNGISCTVVTTSKDENGNETSKTTVLQSGSSSGAQIKLANNVMTQDVLDRMYEALKFTNYYPFSLNWNGNPAVEAGDWLTVEDLQGNEFKVPNMSYTLTYNGGLTATSKADTSVSSPATYSYGGSMSNIVNEIGGREGAEGNHIYEGTEDQEPTLSKEGDLWYKHVGPDTEERIYKDGKWEFLTSTKTANDAQKAADQASKEAEEAKKQANKAVDGANDAVAKAGFANDTANQAKSDAAAAGQQAKDALTSAGTAITNAKNALTNSSSAQADSAQARKYSAAAVADAATALTDAKKALTDSGSATVNSTQAIKDSATAKIKATNAAIQANQAVTDASTAKADANTAKANATQAIDDAAAAKGQASNALGQANTAIGNAADALSKVDNLSFSGRNLLPSTNQGLTNWTFGAGNGGSYNKDAFDVPNGKGMTMATTVAYSNWFYLGYKLNYKVLKQNTDYVLSFWARSTGIDRSIQARFANGGTANTVALFNSVTLKAGEKTYVIMKAKTNAVEFSDQYLYFHPFSQVGGIDIWDLQLVEGTNALRDWSAAPEDVQIQIDNVNGELSQKVSQTTYNTLAGTVDTVNTLAKQNQSTIGTLATKTSVDTVNKTATTAQTLAQQNATELLNKASTNTVDTLTQRVTTAESTLSQTATKAELALTKTEVDKLNDTVKSQGVTLDATATKAELQVAQTNVDNLKKTVTSNSAGVTANANALKLKADSSTVSDLDGRVTSLSGQLDVQSDLISAKVTASDVTGMLGNYATQTWTQSQIKLTAEGINATLSSVKSTVDGHTTSINDLKADSSGFKSQFTRVTDAIGKHTTDIGTLQASSQELTTGFNTLTTDNTTNKNDISQLKQTATELNSTMMTVQTQVQNSAVGTNLLVGTGNNLSTTGKNSSNQLTNDCLLTNGYNISTLVSALGTQFTISYDWSVSGSSPSGTFNAIWNNFPWGNGSNIAALNKVSSSNTSGHFSRTFSLSADSKNIATAVHFRLDNFVGTLTISNVKLEKGSVATDWCPNPADNASVTALSKLSQTVNGIQTTVSGKADQSQVTQLSNQISLKADTTALNEVKGTVDKQGSEIALNTKSITLKADQSFVNTIKGTVDKQGSAIDINTKNIALKANQSVVDTLSGRVSTAEGKITVQADQIAQTVSKTELTSKLNSYATQTWTQSQIKSTADSINLSVSKVQNNVDSMQIGAVNLIVRKDEHRDKMVGYDGTIQYYQFSAVMDKPIPAKGGEFLTLTRYGNAQPGQGDNFFRYAFFDKDGKLILRSAEDAMAYTMQTPANSVTMLISYPYTVPVKLERGKKSTEWSLAPEDQATEVQFSQLQVTVNGIQGTVQNKADQSQVTQLAGQITSVVGDVSANSSQITQMKADINLRVKAGDVVNQINISPESILIAGQKVHITGQTTIDNAVIKDAMIANVTADKITAGTLNAANVNVINLNADNITTGTLKGANLSMNLNTGEILFQKGAIRSTNGNLNIDVNDGTLSIADSLNRGVIFRNGIMSLSDITYGSNVASKYGTVSFEESIIGSLGTGMKLSGAHGTLVGMPDYHPDSLFSPTLQFPTTGGVGISKNYLNVEAARIAALISGKSYLSVFMTQSPTVQVGAALSHTDGTAWTLNTGSGPETESGSNVWANGKVIAMEASGSNTGSTGISVSDLSLAVDGRSGYVLSMSAYSRTYSSGKTATITPSGVLGTISSASKYKLAIGEISTINDEAHRFISVKPKQWFDKTESDTVADMMTTGNDNYVDDAKTVAHTGFIAEDLYTAGLDSYVIRGNDGSLESIQYDRLPVLHHELIRELFNRLDAAELEIYKLKQEANNAS